MLIRFLIASFRRSLVVAAVLLTLCSGSSLSAEELTSGVTGLVFEDLNENGRHDDGEPGIAGVAVSDQIDVVVSGADGSYKLDTSGRFDLVVLSVPSGFKTQGPIWRRIDSEVSVDSVDFPLNRRENTTEFTFLHASDPHIEDKSLNRTQLLRQLVVDLEPDLVLITGDLVANAPGVGEERAKHDFELFLQEAGSISVPVYVVPGNRDTFGVERHNSLVSAEHPLFGKEMFRHYFGPNYYSFDWGGVHFIALDSVVYQEIWYHGHIDDTQLAWLKADLSHVASGTPVVTFQHIPFVSSAELLFGHSKNPLAPSLITVDGKTKYRHTVGNHKKVLEVLKPHRFTLALGGHLHMAERLSFEADG
ncbi:MAG: hypothetical protein GY906_12715, partial [bacterium]|nr:hypothetical protein [bacterium]